MVKDHRPSALPASPILTWKQGVPLSLIAMPRLAQQDHFDKKCKPLLSVAPEAWICDVAASGVALGRAVEAWLFTQAGGRVRLHAGARCRPQQRGAEVTRAAVHGAGRSEGAPLRRRCAS